jgi:hypothetical protein
MGIRIVLTSVAALAILGLSGGASAAADYSFTTINNPGDPSFNQLLGINAAGTIAGYFGDGVAVANNGFTTVPPYTNFTGENFPGAFETQVTGLNNSGATVGFYINGDGSSHGFVAQGGAFTTVDNPASGPAPFFNQLLGINDHDVAAGVYLNGDEESEGELVNLSKPGSPVFTSVAVPGAMATTATDVNNSDVVSGFFTNAIGNTEGFILSGGAFIPLNFGNDTNTMALGLNNRDEVVGSYVDADGDTRGFVYNWLTDKLTTIDDPNADGSTDFMVEGTTVNGINDRGQLVGFYAGGGAVNGFLANPVPEASTWAMMLAGFAGLGLIARRVSKHPEALQGLS